MSRIDFALQNSNFCSKNAKNIEKYASSLILEIDDSKLLQEVETAKDVDDFSKAFHKSIEKFGLDEENIEKVIKEEIQKRSNSTKISFDGFQRKKFIRRKK